MFYNSLRSFIVILTISQSLEVPKDRLSSMLEMEDMEIDHSSNLIDSDATKDEQNSRPLTDQDFENGRKLTEDQLQGLDRKIDKQKLLNDKNLFEGDIIVQNITELMFFNAVRSNSNKWRNGRIPYVLSNQYNDEQRSLIARVFEEFHNKTCIRFVPKRWFHFSYLRINPGVGCASLVGRVGGGQVVSLGSGCLTLGVVEHELMHAVGFWHEQSRADRDDWVRINWDNVEKGMEGNFVKFSWNDIQSLGVGYDYASVMHYGTHAFAKGFGATLSPLKDVPQGVKIGQRISMSDKDIKKINNLYDCGRDLRTDNLITSLIRLIIDF